MLYSTLNELFKAEADQAPLFSLNNAYALPFPVQHPSSFEKQAVPLDASDTYRRQRSSSVLRPQTMLHGSCYSRRKIKGAGLEISSHQQGKSLTRHFRAKTKEKKKWFVYMLHKCSVSILRTLPCLQRHVLPRPAGPSRGSCAVPEDTAPAQAAVPWPRSQPHSLWPLCSSLYTEQQETGPPTMLLWGQGCHLGNTSRTLE